MMGEAAGWYRDPAPANPAAPSTLRFWDGMQWTTRVKAAPKRERQAWQAEAAQQRRAYVVQQSQQLQATGYAGQSGVLVDQGSRDHTADGEPLAGWWRRVGATVIDAVAAQLLSLLFGWHFVIMMVTAFSTYVTGAEEAARAGSAAPGTDAFTHDFLYGYIGFAVVGVLVRLVYDVGFLKAFQATPGKMALGLEVRLRERPGVLSWGTVLLRWAAQRPVGLLVVVPVVGPLVVFVYPLLDSLWPLWDGHRQALHDKLARTNVVRRG